MKKTTIAVIVSGYIAILLLSGCASSTYKRIYVAAYDAVFPPAEPAPDPAPPAPDHEPAAKPPLPDPAGTQPSTPPAESPAPDPAPSVRWHSQGAALVLVATADIAIANLDGGKGVVIPGRLVGNTAEFPDGVALLPALATLASGGKSYSVLIAVPNQAAWVESEAMP